MPFMDKKLTIGDVDIVVVATNHNPSILNPDFLARNKIVDESWGWKLARDPLTTAQVSQVAYDSGVSILAEFGRLIFRDVNNESIEKGSAIGQIASRYVSTLPHVSYTAVGVNVKGHAVAASPNEATNLVMQSLIKDGPWLKHAPSIPKGSVTLIYTLKECRLTLTVSEGLLTVGEDKGKPCVIFESNFHRDIKQDDQAATIKRLEGVFTAWEQDRNEFRRIAETWFLGA